MQRTSGFAQQGARRVWTMSYPSSNLFQETFPFAKITVYFAGTTTLATIFSDNRTPPTPLTNPFSANENGFWFFYAANGNYDIEINPRTPGDCAWTLSDIPISDPSSTAASLTGGTGIVVSPDAGPSAATSVSLDPSSILLNNGICPPVTIQFDASCNVVWTNLGGNNFFTLSQQGDVYARSFNASIGGGGAGGAGITTPSILLNNGTCSASIQFNAACGIVFAGAGGNPLLTLSPAGDLSIAGDISIGGGGASQWINIPTGGIYYSAGPVGIGASNPQLTLEIKGPHVSGDPGSPLGAGGPVRITGTGDAVTPGVCYLELDAEGSPTNGYAAVAFYMNGAYGGEIAYQGSDNSLVFWDGGERLRIMANGQIGINTGGAPGGHSVLTVADIGFSVGTSGYHGITVEHMANDGSGSSFYCWKQRGSNPVQAGDWIAYLGWGGLVNGFTGNQGCINAQINPDGITADTLFFTNDGTDQAGNGVERLRITANGRIGVNQSTPQYQLDVTGSIHSSTKITVDFGVTPDIASWTGNLPQLIVADSTPSDIGGIIAVGGNSSNFTATNYNIGQIVFADFGFAGSEKRLATIAAAPTGAGSGTGNLAFYIANAGNLQGQMSLSAWGDLIVSGSFAVANYPSDAGMGVINTLGGWNVVNYGPSSWTPGDFAIISVTPDGLSSDIHIFISRATGNVGINPWPGTVPQYTLDVNGTIAARGDQPNAGQEVQRIVFANDAIGAADKTAAYIAARISSAPDLGGLDFGVNVAGAFQVRLNMTPYNTFVRTALNVYDYTGIGAEYSLATDEGYWYMNMYGSIATDPGAFYIGYSPGAGTGPTVHLSIRPDGSVQLPHLTTTNPGAGTKQLWADPADGYRVKWAS